MSGSADAALGVGIADGRVSVTRTVPARAVFLDQIRSLMIVLVVAYHSVAAYSTVAPHFPYHDTSFLAADLVREFLDVFMMPVLFFVAGYFALASLDRKGVGQFVKDKAGRLLIPWLLAVLVLIPLLTYSRPEPPVRPFWTYWLWYIGSFETGLGFLPSSQPSQAIYWFIWLLFAFFVVFALSHTVVRRWMSGSFPPAARKAPSGNAVLMTLFVFGVVTSAAHFVSLLLFPDTSWFTLGLFLQFEPTRIVFFVGYFALGIYARSREWFIHGTPLAPVWACGAFSVALAVTYLVIAQPLFADPAGTPQLPAAYLLAIAFIRSFLLLSLLVAFISVGVRYWNRSNVFSRQLSATSYNIYLTHFWFVVILQESLIAWVGGPAPVKAMAVFVVALAMSFALSRWVIGRFPRSFAAVLLLLFVASLLMRP